MSWRSRGRLRVLALTQSSSARARSSPLERLVGPPFPPVLLPSGDLCEGPRRRLSRFVVDRFDARRAVEVHSGRIPQDRLTIGGLQLPNAQHSPGVLRAPSEFFDQHLHGATREGPHQMPLGRKRVRPAGAQGLELLRRLLVGALLFCFPDRFCARHGVPVQGRRVVTVGEPLPIVRNRRLRGAPSPLHRSPESSAPAGHHQNSRRPCNAVPDVGLRTQGRRPCGPARRRCVRSDVGRRMRCSACGGRRVEYPARMAYGEATGHGTLDGAGGQSGLPLLGSGSPRAM